MTDDFDGENTVTSRTGAIGHGAKDGTVLLTSMKEVASLLGRSDLDLAQTSDVLAAVVVIILETEGLAVERDAGACWNGARSSVGHVSEAPVGATNGFSAA